MDPDPTDHACPIPEDPFLAEIAKAANEAGIWLYLLDPQWRWAFMSRDGQQAQSGRTLAPVPVGTNFFSAESLESEVMRFTYEPRGLGKMLQDIGPWIVADLGGVDALREVAHPEIRDLISHVEPSTTPATKCFEFEALFSTGRTRRNVSLAQRLYDEEGAFHGISMTAQPGVRMQTMSRLVGMSDLGHLGRMDEIAKPSRRPAGVLFADVEGSSALSRRLSTAAYFELNSKLTWAADRCVVEAGGVVGRHVGDGVVAFFPATTAKAESNAAAACIRTSRTMKGAAAEVADALGVADGLTLRFGLHWGATLYIGLISTPGRSEVTALGDEVNEAARIEACATGGRTLASKELVERLDADDGTQLGIDGDSLSYTVLGELPTATEKARRDAPAIAVAEV